MSMSGAGESGVAVQVVWEGVDGGVVMCKEVVARGCGFDGRWFMSSGKMVAINNALVSVDDEEVMAKCGPVRPHGLTSESAVCTNVAMTILTMLTLVLFTSPL
jgi:hypothetical protein